MMLRKACFLDKTKYKKPKVIMAISNINGMTKYIGSLF